MEETFGQAKVEEILAAESVFREQPAEAVASDKGAKFQSSAPGRLRTDGLPGKPNEELSNTLRYASDGLARQAEFSMISTLCLSERI